MGEDESRGMMKNYFSRYYQSWTLDSPERLQARELGFIPFFGTMIRHRKVNTLKEMDTFVKTAVPRHLYYSSAYYRRPDEKKMQDKEWLGAELIFDLDADHIQSERKLTYEETLSLIREHTIRLVEKYLLGDLGFYKSEILLFFSGGRGYHVHVLSDRVYGLTSDSRREIASYIKGEGVSMEEFLKVEKYIPVNHGGWIQGVASLITGHPDLKGMSKQIPTLEASLQVYRTGGVRKQRSVAKSVKELRDANMAEIDEPVTTDVHRLIRYPGSLHGKTGFKVKKVDIDSLANFDPLSECIPEVFTGTEDEVELSERLRITLHGVKYDIPKGKTRLPGHVALYAVLSGRGQFIKSID